MPTFHSRRAAALPNARQLAPVPLTVTAVETSAGRLTHLQGSQQGGQPWRLAVDDARAAIESRRYSLGVRVGRQRFVLVPRDDAARRFEALDRFGTDLMAQLPVIALDPSPSSPSKPETTPP